MKPKALLNKVIFLEKFLYKKNCESKPERDSSCGLFEVPGQPTDQLTAAAHVGKGQAA